MSRPHYLLGRLVAALEHANVLVSPRSVELAPQQPAVHIAPAIARLASTGRSDLVADIMAELPPDALTTTPLTAEGDYWLGYYHQRAEIRRGAAPGPGIPARAEPELDTRYEFRIDTDLKAWIKQNGGDKLIRALLRAARERHAS